ncbi:MAG: ATP-binding protein [Burkholderiales bacterium PBB3]|nr:MAG: ATP-binding protein [Burkholderiales bacterium PBB3]
MKDLLARKLRFDVDFALPLRIPFGLRIFFRAAFALLALATVGLALSVLVEEKQISLRNYQDGFRKNLSQIATQLRHPSGQLALLNAHNQTSQTTTSANTPRTAPGLSPLVLPYAAIDFDDRSKVQQAVEMSGCQVNYAGGATLCVAVGNNPWAGGFIYVAGSLLSADELVPHPLGDADLQQAHRAVVQVALRGQTYRWLAPFETAGDVGSQSQSGAPTVRGRLTGFALDANGQAANRPVRDFRGWLWQDSRCVQAEASSAAQPCAKRWFYSIRLPIDMWRDALLATAAGTGSGNKVRPQWPPADLDRMGVQLQFLPPGNGPALFDSNTPSAVQPFALRDLKAQLQAGETLHISKQGTAHSSDAASVAELAVLRADNAPDADVPHWLNRLIARLPVEGDDVRSEAREVVDTPLGRYALRMTGDGRTVDKTLSTVATRVSWFVGGMLLAIGLTWLAIELRIIRRITLLSRRAATVSQTVRGTDDALALDVSDLQSHDELGVLASALADLLQRVNEDARRERIRTAQEKDQWHAVGHEIMSPLQSLKALHSAPGDASARYIHRMQQAVRVLYGSASPSEAFERTTLQSGTLDINLFLQEVAANAPAAGIAQVEYTSQPVPVLVKADEHALEDAITHVLRNAERYRVPGSPIQMVLDIAPNPLSAGAATLTDNEVHLHISNQGPPIAPDMLGKIFEYGVSEHTDSAAQGNRGQGLFVAKTYLAKMGGTIGAQNTKDGVRFTMGLQRA